MAKISKVLIANRGEIACRIIKSCHRLGIETFAVYSDADRNARHTQLATHALHLGLPTAKDSYLNEAKIIELAKAHDVDAIHPGYGFLSEQQSFAALSAKYGIEFIGPSPNSLSLLGDKASAKNIAEKIGVPTISGVELKKIAKRELTKHANVVGYPLVLKAVHGGGGRGLRVVESEEQLHEAALRANQEAISFFGSGELIIEKFVSPAFHIEIQLIGDKHSTVRHLFERDCSLQRRSQKVIEESPAPFVPKKTLEKLYQAAEAIGKAAKIHSLVTVEFLVSKTERDQFYFLEANPRIQVEHPVTESVLGIDLVELQLKIAEGERLERILPRTLTPKGHAIEARLYAECPERSFQPSTGSILRSSQSLGRKVVTAKEVITEDASSANKLPSNSTRRVDHGLTLSDRITPYYDPMIAKLIAHADTRQTALATLTEMLEDSPLFGIYTNNNFLRLLCSKANEEFTHTKAIDQLLAAEESSCDSPEHFHFAASAAALARYLGEGSINDIVLEDRVTYPIKVTSATSKSIEANFSLASIRNSTVIASLGEDTFSFSIEKSGQGFLFRLDSLSVKVNLPPLSWGSYFAPEVLIDGWRFCIETNFAKGTETVISQQRYLKAPLPGKLIKVLVKSGDKISEGQQLIVLESMKIEHCLTASGSGKVKKVMCKSGEAVNEGEVLLEIV